MSASYVLDMSGARSKAARARTHLEALRGELAALGLDRPHDVPLVRAYEPELHAVVWRVETTVTLIPPVCALVVGDIVHNARAALDHAAWQLALKKYGGAVPDEIVRSVQFPLDDKSKPSNYSRHFCSDDASIVEHFQPFNFGPLTTGALHVLRELSNRDKHRLPVITQTMVSATTAERPVILGAGDPSHGLETINCIAATPHLTMFAEIGPGVEIARVPVQETGPNPDVRLSLEVEAQAMLMVNEQPADLLTGLDAIISGVENVLRRYTPIP